MEKAAPFSTLQASRSRLSLGERSGFALTLALSPEGEGMIWRQRIELRQLIASLPEQRSQKPTRTAPSPLGRGLG
ncbi:hypothetical protein NS201_07565 [Pseudomonas oryzihabitans]|nr:hypothetical protein NS201_07565 [Pseudomonas psychrotolerans]